MTLARRAIFACSLACGSAAAVFGPLYYGQQVEGWTAGLLVLAVGTVAFLLASAWTLADLMGRERAARRAAEAALQAKAYLLEQRGETSQAELDGTKARFAALLAALPGVVYQRVVGPDGDIRYTHISEGCRALFGIAPEEVIENPQALLDCQAPEYRRDFRQRLLKASRELAPWDVEAAIVSRDGEAKFTRAVALPHRQADGGVVWDGIILDTTRGKRAEGHARQLERILDESSNEIYVMDAESLRFVQANRGARDNLGYSDEELLNMTPQDIRLGGGEAPFDFLVAPLRSGAQRRVAFESVLRRKDGTTYPADVRVQLDRAETPPVFIAIAQDVTQRKQTAEEIRRQANFDSLTGLPNRNLFLDRLAQAIRVARRQRGQFAVLFIDLDHFKVINDSLGHVVGDTLLKQAAGRLRACLRRSDTVARFGGDEFTVVLPDLRLSEDAAVVCEKIIERLSEPFLLEDQEVFIGASIGVTVYPADGEDGTTLLRHADLAMYRAKDEGRNVFRFFATEMHEQAQRRMDLQHDLRRALSEGEFALHYQPILDLRSERVFAAEALLRWQHPVEGPVSPMEFVPLAEETGLIAPIGEWVLRRACRDAAEWQARGLEGIGVSVNLSSAQIKRGLTPQSVALIVEESGLKPDLLSFEITESLIMGDAEEAIAWLHQVKKIGIGLSVDDFGTGYSSLSYLKRLPVDIVKIDRSFINDVTTDPESASLVNLIIALVDNLNLEVVAEGVETTEQLDFLRALKCGYAQGYYFSRPLPRADFEAEVGAPRAVSAAE